MNSVCQYAAPPFTDTLSHDQMTVLLDRQPDGVLLIDPFRDRVLFANQSARALLGYAGDELLEMPASRLHPDVLPGLVVFTESVLEQGQGWTSELPLRDRDGEVRQVEYHARRVDLSDRQLLLISLRDLERLKRLVDQARANDFVRRGLSEWRRVEELFEEIERENQLILKAAGEGIYGVNTEGITTFVNPAAERILGWSAEELVGRNMHALIHHSHADGSPYVDHQCPIYAAFRDGAVHQVENEVFWNKQGRPVPVEYTSTPIHQGGHLVGAVTLFRDVSDRKRAEDDLRRALAEVEQLKQRLEMENAYLQEEIREEQNHHEIVGRSRAVRKIIQQIELVAPTDANVLIHGESGTGKELIARAIHESSTRKNRPLIRVNCAAIPRDLFESEFFGHLKGAFTGAVRDRAGRFELADKGTLFLDEVGEIPLELQGKLLRVLQEGQFERVGGDRTLDADVRIIAATNRDLQQAVADKRFREDLFFRLNVFPLTSVPLRDRPENIPQLAAHFLRRACRKFGRTDLQLRQRDVNRMQAYDWPGNVRELENLMERAVIVSKGEALQLDLPAAAQSTNTPPPAATGSEPLELMTENDRRERDRKTIVAALKSTNGKVFGKGGAAELLGLKPTTLASRIKRMGIEKPQQRQP